MGIHTSLVCRDMRCQSQPGGHRERVCLLSPGEQTAQGDEAQKVRGQSGEETRGKAFVLFN